MGDGGGGGGCARSECGSIASDDLGSGEVALKALERSWLRVGDVIRDRRRRRGGSADVMV